jgi:uncharacterized integral membrane protein
MKYAKHIVLALALLVLLIIAIQNREQVETRILFVSFTMPRALLLILMMFLGYVGGAISAYWFLRPKSTKGASSS